MWIVSSFNDEHISPPAIIIATYEDIPKVFLNDPVRNAKRLEYEDIGFGRVYDIIFEGHIETAVAEEWLRPFEL